MSVAFSSVRPRSKGEVTPQSIQKMLDENNHLIQCIMDYQSKGKTSECTQYQQILHRNLVYLATIADSNQNMQSLLPAPPTSNMSLGPGGMGQTGVHAPSNLNDSMAPGMPPTSMMQSQMSNGFSHAPMQQHAGQAQLGVPSTSSYGSSGSSYSLAAPSSQGNMIQSTGPGYGSSSSASCTSSSSSSSRSSLSMQPNQVSMMHQQPAPVHYSSAQTGGHHYQGQQAMGMMGQGSQGNSVMSQRPMGSFRTSQQGSAQQYMGQDEFYGEQYGHIQSSSEPINQQYYPDDFRKCCDSDDRNAFVTFRQSMVMGSTHISSLHTGNKVTKGHLMSLRSIIMKVTPSTVNSSSFNKVQASSSTPLSKATAGCRRDTVLAREDHHSTLSFSRIRTNSMDHIAPPREVLDHKPRGLTRTNRVNMGIFNNEAPHCCCWKKMCT